MKALLWLADILQAESPTWVSSLHLLSPEGLFIVCSRLPGKLAVFNTFSVTCCFYRSKQQENTPFLICVFIVLPDPFFTFKLIWKQKYFVTWSLSDTDFFLRTFLLFISQFSLKCGEFCPSWFSAVFFGHPVFWGRIQAWTHPKKSCCRPEPRSKVSRTEALPKRLQVSSPPWTEGLRCPPPSLWRTSWTTRRM